MKNFKLLFALLILILVSTGCGLKSALAGLKEPGEIIFIDPTPGAKNLFHDEDAGTGLSFSVIIMSLFDDLKELTLSADGYIWTCIVAKGSNPCPGGKIMIPGEHIIRAEGFRRDGSVFYAETKITWIPYSPLDKTMQKVSQVFGSDNPLPGYGLIGFLIACIAAGVFGKIFGAQWGAILGFFLALIGLAFFFGQAGSTVMAGQVLTLIGSVIGAALFAVIIFTMIKNGYMATTGGFSRITDLNKTVTMGSGPSIGPGDKVSTPEKMTEAAEKHFPSPQEYRALPPSSEESLIEVTQEKPRGLFGR